MEHLRAEALRAIADGKQMQRSNKHGEWSNCPPDMALFILAKSLPSEIVRIAPKFVVVNNTQLPAPIRSSNFEVCIQLRLADQTADEECFCFDTNADAGKVYGALIKPFKED
jgi:hypothetical protein